MDKQIERIMNKLVISGATPGINYAVIKDNNKYIGSIGLRGKYKLEDGIIKESIEENSIDTIYDLASLTKVICTLPLIFKLVESGKISLNDSVKKYINLFQEPNVTIYDLLIHVSGIYADLNKRINSKEFIVDKLYKSYIKNLKGQFKYTDIGYMILGLVIEKIYDKSLDEIFEKEVVYPLEMENTSFNPKDKKLVAPTEITADRGVVRGIVHDEKACSMNGVAGHAGVFSNTEDLINFSCMVLNNGIFKGKKYLNESTIDMWFKPLISDRIYKRSFSWFVGDNPNIIEGENTISFHGFTGPSISIDREKNIIIVMMTNRVHPTRDNKLNTEMRSNISKEIYENLFDESLNKSKTYIIKK